MMPDLGNRTNYKHAAVQDISPGADENEIGKALDWIIERCHEIGETHDPTKCYKPPNDQSKHHCPIWLETFLLKYFATNIADFIGWQILARPFDIYFTPIDSEQSEQLIYKAVFIQDGLKGMKFTGMTQKQEDQLSEFMYRLVAQASRTHTYVRLSPSILTSQ